MQVSSIIRHLEEAAYSPPRSPERLMCDFYVMAWCSTAPSDPTDPRSPASFISRRGLKDEIDETFDTLTRSLQAHLLQVLQKAIISEWCHFAHRGWFPAKFEPTLRPDQRRVLGQMRSIGSPKGDFVKYWDQAKATARNGGDAAISLARACFQRGVWREKYGGKVWATICDAYFSLQDAASTRDRAVQIDHVYDLQHNTDTVFNKDSQYSKTGMGDGYTWIKKLLDVKANMTSVVPLLPKCSPYVRRLGYATMKMAGLPAPEQPVEKPVPLDYPPLTGKQFLDQHPGWEKLYGVRVSSGGRHGGGGKNDTRWTIYALKRLTTGELFPFYVNDSEAHLTSSDLSNDRTDDHSAAHATGLKEPRGRTVTKIAWELPDLKALYRPASAPPSPWGA